MILRDQALPGPWYPRNPQKIEAFLAPLGETKGHKRQAVAAVSPHAGWFYSGKIAARSLAALDREAETLAVIGGHLPAGAPPLFALEDGVRTPLGAMAMDGELREALMKKIGGREDRYQDNTVEVLLPMARYFFPHARLLWLRLPAELASLKAGALLAETAQSLGRRLAVLGSTDLTHYGPNYGFSPRGTGRAALDWVRSVNDAAFIRAVQSGNAEAILERAEADFSACSAGAVLGALGFVQAAPSRAELPKKFRMELLDYGTSADVQEGEIPDSFVGYASLAWYPAG